MITLAHAHTHIPRYALQLESENFLHSYQLCAI